MDEISEFILNALTTKYELPADELSVDSTFDELDLDSLTLLEILIALEKKFDVVIPQDALSEMQSIRETAAQVAALSHETGLES